MNTILTGILLLSAPFVAWPAEIPKNAHVLLKMMNTISTRTGQEGMQVYMQTASPVSDGNQILIPVGSYVQGTVLVSRQSGKVTGRAQMAIRLDMLTLPGGKTLKFSPHITAVDDGETSQKVVNDEGMVQQGGNVGKDVERIAILAGSGAGLGGLADRSWKGAGIGGAAGSAVGLATVLFSRGKEVELRQGSTIDVVFDRPLAVD
jgi:hypothetical protein